MTLHRRVRLPADVRGDLPFDATVAPAGVYEAELNPHGAVSVRATNGTMIGIKPDEMTCVGGLCDGSGKHPEPVSSTELCPYCWEVR